MSPLARPRALWLALLAPACTTALPDGQRTDGLVPDTCPPADVFAHAVCVCEDFDQVGQLTVSPGPAGTGAVGVNGYTRFVNQTTAAGSWIAYGGFEAVSDADIGEDLSTAADASWVGAVSVGGDLSVGGDARGVGALEVAGSLRVAGQESLLGPSDVAARGAYEEMAGPPCGCDGDGFFDVATAVAAAAPSNDNAAAGLDGALSSVGDTEVRLPTGTYHLADAAVVGRTRFVIEGEVSLFVAGHLDAVGDQSFTLADGATLDLFVDGGVRTVGRLSTGSASDPGAFRLYVGGDDAVVLSVGAQTYHGNIYAPEARIGWVGDTLVVGSLFARTLDGVGRLEIEYGAPAELDPDACEPDDGPGGDSGAGDGDSGDGAPIVD